MIRFQFVEDHRTEYSVKRMCHVLKLNRSSYYKWANTRHKRTLRTCSDALIGAKIKAIFDDEAGLYGAKRWSGLKSRTGRLEGLPGLGAIVWRTALAGQSPSLSADDTYCSASTTT